MDRHLAPLRLRGHQVDLVVVAVQQHHQVRRWCGARSSARSNASATTCFADRDSDAVKHFPRALVPVRRPLPLPEVSSSAVRRMMSYGRHTAGSAS